MVNCKKQRIKSLCDNKNDVELGTGKYYPGGRQDPWVYQDAHGNWRMTHGQRAKPYLKPAVADHAQQYKQIIENELKG